MGIDKLNTHFYIISKEIETMNNYLIITTKDSTGTFIDYIKLKYVESFSISSDGERIVVTMRSGRQHFISNKFSTCEQNTQTVPWEELPRIISNG